MIARRRWLVIFTTLVFVGIAVAVSLVPEPEYRVRAQVLTTGVNDPVSMIFGNNNAGDLNRQATSQLAFLTSSRMRFKAAEAYNGSLSKGEVFKVSVQPVDTDDSANTSSVVELSLVSTDPVAAATMVNVYAQTYVELRENADRERLTKTKGQLQALVQQYESQLATLRQPITDIEADIAAGGNVDILLPQRQRLEEDLADQVAPLQAQITEINETLGSINLGVELAAGGGAEVLSDAGAPDTPVSPNLPLNLALGLVFGLFLGTALAFVRDYFDDSVKSKEMVERVTGVSTLGLIPKLDPGVDVVTITQPSSPAAEAFRLLRTSVKFLAVERQVRVVQVTSPAPGEGKTMVAVNLAVAFAQAGDRVVLVGGDLRRPHMEEILDVPLTPGLTARADRRRHTAPGHPDGVGRAQPVGAAVGLPAAEPVGAAVRRAGPAPDRRPGPDLRRGRHRLPAGAAGDRLAGAGPDGRHHAAGHVVGPHVQAQPGPGRRAAAPGRRTAGGHGAQQPVAGRHVRRRAVPLRDGQAPQGQPPGRAGPGAQRRRSPPPAVGRRGRPRRRVGRGAAAGAQLTNLSA